MKYFRLLLFVLILNIPAYLCQNFFPNKPGAQYIRQDEVNHWNHVWGGNSTGYSTLEYDSTTTMDSIIFGGRTYYSYFDNSYCYDRQNQKLYIYMYMDSLLAVDFNAPADSYKKLYFDRNVRWYKNSGIYIDSIFGAQRTCFKITFDSTKYGTYYGYPQKRWHYEYIFVDSIGLYKSIDNYREEESPDKFYYHNKLGKNVFVDIGNVKFAELYPPSFTDAVLISDSKLLLRWVPKFIRDGFIIERKISSGFDYVPIDTTDQLSIMYIDDGVVPGNEYFYRIRAIKSGMISPPSNAISVNTLLQPGIISADTTTQGKIILSWDYSPTLYDGFILERRYWINFNYNGFIWSNYEALDTLENGSMSYEDTDVSIAPYFIYRLKVFKDSVMSDYSPLTMATPNFPAPERPANFRIDSSSTQSIKLVWERNDAFTSYYIIQRRELPYQSEFTNIHSYYIRETYFVDQSIEPGKSYAYRVRATFANRHSEYSDTIYTRLTSVENNVLPAEFELMQNYPNPFNPSTTITYTLKNGGHVKLSVYDMKGELVAHLVNEYQSAGSYAKNFSSETYNLSSGVYIYRIDVLNEGGNNIFHDSRKSVLLK